MDKEQYPVNRTIWNCIKCNSSEFTEDIVTMTGKSWSRFMNIQNRKFASISCDKCGYTEFYRGNSKSWENVIDFFGN